MRTRVLIVDDKPQVRQELRSVLPLAGPVEIVGEAGDGREAVQAALRLRPEVVLLDLEMPVMDGYAAAREIKQSCSNCRVIALSVHSEPAERAKAGAAGCDDFIEKGMPLASILEAIRAGVADPGETSESEREKSHEREKHDFIPPF